MDALLYLAARALVALIQMLPLLWAARLGRFFGGMAYWLDSRHRRVAIRNLAQSFPSMKSGEVRAIAREHFRRLGENYVSAVKTAAIATEALAPNLKMVGMEKVLPHQAGAEPKNRVVAIGHFGNFELYARLAGQFAGFQGATTYRGLRQPALNRLMQSLRGSSGCLYFERRTDAAALRKAMNESGLLLGLLADQHAGRSGVRVPFFGRECSTSTAPAVLALRYQCPLHTAICFRTALGRWVIEIGEEIPTHIEGKPRPVETIMTDVNRAFEAAVLRDPANWFWVHNRWKPVKPRVRAAKAMQ